MIEQFHCHYEKLEEYTFGMWRRPESGSFDDLASLALGVMSDLEKFSLAMTRVCEEWENSCKVNFTDSSVNPVSWLGQAALCCVYGVPSICTRSAWMNLSAEKQEKANSIARGHVDRWRKDYIGQGELFNEI